jgi:hypothetical protein
MIVMEHTTTDCVVGESETRALLIVGQKGSLTKETE